MNETKSIEKTTQTASTACSNGPAADEESIARLADFYKVMGDVTRLKLLIALESQELCVSDLAAMTGMTLSAVSHQLKTLKSACLVRSRKEGKTVYYALDDDHIHSIIKVALAHVLEAHD